MGQKSICATGAFARGECESTRAGEPKVAEIFAARERASSGKDSYPMTTKKQKPSSEHAAQGTQSNRQSGAKDSKQSESERSTEQARRGEPLTATTNSERSPKQENL